LKTNTGAREPLKWSKILLFIKQAGLSVAEGDLFSKKAL
jgi:hypothetical protein